MQNNVISVSCEGKMNLDMFTCSTTDFLLKSPLSSSIPDPFFSAFHKLSCTSHKTARGLRVTSLNRLPTGGEVTALAGSDSWSPLLTHQGSAVSS